MPEPKTEKTDRKTATFAEAIEKAAANVRMALRRVDDSVTPELATRARRISLDLAEISLLFQRAELDGA